MKTPIGNGLQAAAIRRYHSHLQRLGRAGTLEQSARQWISRYAVAWRKQHPIKPRSPISRAG
jgi:hypothetical protein